MSKRTNAELADLIQDTENRLGLSHAWTLPALNRMRKAELVQALRTLVVLAETSAHREAELRNATVVEESVNERVNGTEVATRWLNLPEHQRTESPEQMASRMAEVPSPQRDYQSSQEALAVIEEYLADEWDAANINFAATLGSETVLHDQPMPGSPAAVAQAEEELPITETDVADAQVQILVQQGKDLVWGTLISVVNRRTRFSPKFLVTVEVAGTRKLFRADHTLAA